MPDGGCHDADDDWLIVRIDPVERARGAASAPWASASASACASPLGAGVMLAWMVLLSLAGVR